MNKGPTLQLLRKHFQNLSEVGPELVRAERRRDSRPFGVFYFDFSQSITRPEFDLSAFVQQRLATDFYKHEGSLQWNYYLYFVLDAAAFKELRASPRIAAIESDRTFARKYVRDQAALNKEISESLAATLHGTEMAQDIASRWVKELGDAGLIGIANLRADYAPIIRHYLDGKASQRPISGVSEPVQAERGGFIRSIDLGNFRLHPASRGFEFGRVNLIRGVNGSGKTSLLEAIELCICGGNRRQGGMAPSNAALKLQVQGQSRTQNCPVANASVYRSRDRSWYGGYYLQGNRLCQNFARFNFFDTDAAAQLSKEGTGEGIQAAINTLFLGEFANSIEERMRQCNERFTRELREMQKLVRVRRAEHRKAVEDLESLRTIKDTRETLVEELQLKARVCHWKRTPKITTLSDLELLKESAASEADLFTEAVERIRWLGRLSIQTLERELDLLRDSLSEVKRLRDLLQTNSVALEKDRDRLEVVEVQLEIVSRLTRYHSEPDAFSLLGTAKAIDGLKREIERLNQAFTLMRDVDLAQYRDTTTSINDLIKSHTADIAEGRRNLNRLRGRFAELQKQVGQIKSVIEQITGLGNLFCDINPTAKECPLCGAEYVDLRERLNSIATVQLLEPSLGELTARISRSGTELALLETSLKALQRLNQIDLLITGRSTEVRSAKSAIKDLNSLAERQASVKGRLDRLVAMTERLQHAGFTENDLHEILDTAVRELNLPRTRLKNAGTLQSLQIEITKTRKKLRESIADRMKVEKSHAAEQRQEYKKRLGSQLFDDPATEIQRRFTVVDEILSSLRSSSRRIEINAGDELLTTAARLEAFMKAIGRIYESFKRVEQKGALETRLVSSIGEAKKELAKLEPRESRAKAAITKLDELLGSDYKDAYLQDVRATHKDKLTTIFLRIHAPQDFTDVRLNAEVRLKRHSGSYASVREISTGQRAALALSIFLALNSSVSRHAPWLLFDDPVAHVDDLNILSFFDVLRELVFLGDRQIFFATANTRVADLFARKFDFLGTDFHVARLPR